MSHLSPSKTKPFWRYFIHNPELVCTEIILVAFLILASLQVVSRYVFNAPFVWTEELSSSLVIWMVFLGASAVQREDGQIRVEILDNLLPARITAWIYLVYDIFVLAFLIALIYGGWKTLGELSYEKTPALQIPLKYLFLVVPLAAISMSVYVIRNAFRRIRLTAKENKK